MYLVLPEAPGMDGVANTKEKAEFQKCQPWQLWATERKPEASYLPEFFLREEKRLVCLIHS